MPTLTEALALMPKDAITRVGTANGGSDQALAAAAGRTVLDFANYTVDIQNDGVIYDPVAGDIDCSGFNVGQEIAIRYSFTGTPTAAAAQWLMEIIVPVVANVVYKKDYHFPDANTREFTQTANLWVTQDVIDNGLQVRISNPGSQILTLEDRHIYIKIA